MLIHADFAPRFYSCIYQLPVVTDPGFWQFRQILGDKHLKLGQKNGVRAKKCVLKHFFFKKNQKTFGGTKISGNFAMFLKHKILFYYLI